MLVGLSHDYKNMAQWLDDNLIPETADEFRKTEGFCISGNDFYKNRTMGAYFKRGAQSWSDPIPTSVFRDTGKCFECALSLWMLLLIVRRNHGIEGHTKGSVVLV